MRYLAKTTSSAGSRTDSQNKYNSWYLVTKETNHVGFLVDNSGSMHSTYNNVVEQGIEQFLKEEMSRDDILKFYGYTFSDTPNKLFDGVNLKGDNDLEKVKDKFYSVKCNGCTALYDAISEILKSIDKKCYPGDSVVVCCMTDGLDNRSVLGSSTVKKIIKHSRKKGWIICMIGTTESKIYDQIEVLGLSDTSVMEIGRSQCDSQKAYRNLSVGLTQFRNGDASTFKIKNNK